MVFDAKKYNKEYKKKHKERIAKYAKEYFLQNREIINANARKNYHENKERKLEYARLYREKKKQKSELQKISNRSFDEKISPSKREANLDKLKSISKSFKEFGNSEEYYNSLKKDFGLSPEGAASIAYPLSKQSENYIRTIKPSNAENAYSNPVKYANDLVDYLTREDSLLSIAKNIKSKDPFFDIRAFLSEVRSIEDQLGLTAQQKLELNTRGTDDIFPNWGDIFLFPKGGRGL